MKDINEKKILEFLRTNGYCSVEGLAEYLAVSPSTVRRTLNILQSKGLVERTHGGVQLNDQKSFTPSFTFRIHQNILEKKKIALSAIKLIKNGDLIFLDGSTSSFYIADYLSEFENIRVVTNGIDTLSLLSKNKVCAYSTGGQVSKENRSVLIGKYAENTVNNFHADIAFFSAQSLTNNGEIYDCFEEENFIRKAMIQNSEIKVLLCDSTKIGSKSVFRLCSACDIDYIVSNTPVPDSPNLKKVKNLVSE